jgi:hypothetical protein
MRVGIMVTNHGTHPPEKWATESAAQIVDVIQIDADSIVYDSMSSEKSKLEGLIEAALVDHHDVVRNHELECIDCDQHDRLDASTDPEAHHLADAVAAVQACSDQTMFKAHFRKPEVVKFVESTLGSHFATVKHIERSQFADDNIDHPKAQAFKGQQV